MTTNIDGFGNSTCVRQGRGEGGEEGREGRENLTVLLEPQTAAATKTRDLPFGLSVISNGPGSYSVYIYVVVLFLSLVLISKCLFFASVFPTLFRFVVSTGIVSVFSFSFLSFHRMWYDHTAWNWLLCLLHT